MKKVYDFAIKKGHSSGAKGHIGFYASSDEEAEEIFKNQLENNPGLKKYIDRNKLERRDFRGDSSEDQFESFEVCRHGPDFCSGAFGYKDSKHIYVKVLERISTEELDQAEGLLNFFRTRPAVIEQEEGPAREHQAQETERVGFYKVQRS